MKDFIHRTRFVSGGLLLGAAGLVVISLNGSRFWNSSGEIPREGAALVASPPEAVVDGEGRNPGTSRVSFTITNIGSRTVRIVSVETTCGCTVAEAHSGVRLTPKASTALAVSATPPQFGNKETYVIVNTDDPAAPQLRIKLTLRGREVKPPYITVAPTELRLQTSRPGEILSRGFEVRTVERRAEPPWLSRDQSVPNDLKAFWVEPPVEIKYDPLQPLIELPICARFD